MQYAAAQTLHEEPMRIYSAGEAIGPAWEHTKALLFADRRFGRLLKLFLVAFGAQLGSGLTATIAAAANICPRQC